MTQLDDKFLYALKTKEIDPISVEVRDSESTKGKKLYLLFMQSTIMDYEIKAIERYGFELVWTSVSRGFGKPDCCLEVAFKETE